MIIESISLIQDARVISYNIFSDARGSLNRLWDRDVFAKNGIEFSPAQINYVKVMGRGTLKGLHFQSAPSSEAKLIICLCGSIFDVMVDTRKNSPTFRNWYGITLNSSIQKAIFVPANIAHGLQNLEDRTEVLYIHGDFYLPEHEKGVNPLDPEIGIRWPLEPLNISQKDLLLPSFQSLIEGEN